MPGFDLVLALLLVIVAVSFDRLLQMRAEMEATAAYEHHANLADKWLQKTQLNVNRVIAIAKAAGQPDVDAQFAPLMKQTTAEITEIQKAFAPANRAAASPWWRARCATARRASSEQSEGIGQVNTSVTQLDKMTQQNAALVEQSAAAAESLKARAMKLAGLVGAFKLHGAESAQESTLG